MSHGITILTSLNKINSFKRQQEIAYCFEKNYTIPGVNEIIIFTENKNKTFGNYIDKVIKFYNIKIVLTIKRPTYYDLVNYANEKLCYKPVIICNSDIYFDNEVSIINDIDLTNKFYPLTRWMYADDGQAYLPWLFNSNHPINKIKEKNMTPLNCWLEGQHPNQALDTKRHEEIDWSEQTGKEFLPNEESLLTFKSTGKNVYWKNEYSADAWIFQPPVFKDTPDRKWGQKLEDLKIPLGTFRCDTMLNYILIQEHILSKLDVRNPCLTLKCYHHDFLTTERSKSYYDDALAATDKHNHLLHRCYIPWETLNDKS